jgi:hypothetical protein
MSRTATSYYFLPRNSRFGLRVISYGACELFASSQASLKRGTPRQGIGKKPKSADKLLCEQRRNRL